MDCHRYHPYAPAADPRQERNWYRREYNSLPRGHRGARSGRYSSGRRGTGSVHSLDREEMYHPPSDHRLVRPGERHLDDSRYKGPQRRPPPWYHYGYGPPRPPTNYNYMYERERNLRWSSGNNRVHYRGAGYSPPARLHPKSMRSASVHPTGLVLSF